MHQLVLMDVMLKTLNGRGGMRLQGLQNVGLQSITGIGFVRSCSRADVLARGAELNMSRLHATT